MKATQLDLRTYAENLAAAWDRFFFGFSAPKAVGVFRIMFGLTLLLSVVLRMFGTDAYFTDASGIGIHDIKDLLPDFFRPAVMWYPKTLQAAWFFQIAEVAALLLLVVGVFGRIGSRVLGALILFCHLGLMQRNYSIVYGADMVATFWIFGFCFLDSTEEFSLRAWWSRRARAEGRLVKAEPEWSRIFTSVGARLLQIQLCVVYMYTGFEKLKGGDWWDQTAVWKVLGNSQLMTTDLSFLRNVPLVIGAATWGTVLFEVYCAVLFWPRATRKWMLALGWLLHIGIALTMGLYIFSLTMMSAYVLFADFLLDEPTV